MMWGLEKMTCENDRATWDSATPSKAPRPLVPPALHPARIAAIALLLLGLSCSAVYYGSTCSAKGALGCLGDITSSILQSGSTIGEVSRIELTEEELQILGPVKYAQDKDMPPWFEEVAVGLHEEDRDAVRQLRTLMAPIAQNNTVIIVSTNYGFFNMSLNVLCRLRRMGVTNVLTWALDKESALLLAREGMPFYFDPALFSVNKPTSYYDPEYVRMMTERPAVWWRMLATGFDLLFLDSDIVVFRDPMLAFVREADIEGQVDERDWAPAQEKERVPDMCAGAFWIRSKPQTLRVLDLMKRAIEAHARRPEERFDDQYALNAVIHDEAEAVVLNRGPRWNATWQDADLRGRLRVRFVEPSDVMGGRLEKHHDREVGKGDFYNVTFVYKHLDFERRVSPVIFHLNGRGLEKFKVRILSRGGWWEVNGAGQCRTDKEIAGSLRRAERAAAYWAARKKAEEDKKKNESEKTAAEGNVEPDYTLLGSPSTQEDQSSRQKVHMESKLAANGGEEAVEGKRG